MFKDNTEFRDRFARWKAGEQVYENGRPLPAYGDGKVSRKWTPNQQTRRSISRYEGDAMVKDTIDPLTGKMVKKNASFESVADSFVSTFSPETWEKVKGNDALLQALYHYAYNIGPGKFKERTLPMVDAYYRGEATVRDIQNAMWAHGDKKLRGLANRRIAERAMVEKALSDQFPAASQVPYRNDDYNYYRANQLGYKPDETGHMPSRDEVTGMYLKSPTHPTIMKSVVQDLSEGYQPYYNKQDGKIYSQPVFDIKQQVEGQLFKGLPGYGDGKTPFRYIYAGKENKPIRITNDDMGLVFQGLEVTPRKTTVKHVPKQITEEYNRHRAEYLKTHNESGKPLYEPGLELVSPEFDVLSAVRGIAGMLTKKPSKDIILNKTIKQSKFSDAPHNNTSDIFDKYILHKASKQPRYTASWDDFQTDPKFGKYFAEGGEAEIYESFDNPGYLTKVKLKIPEEGQTLEDLEFAVNRDLSMNQLPGVEPITYKGFSTPKIIRKSLNQDASLASDEFVPIFEQRRLTPLTKTKVDAFNNTTYNDLIRQWIIQNGYKEDVLSNMLKYRNITISDHIPRNFAFNSYGDLKLIDPMIQKFKYGKSSKI